MTDLSTVSIHASAWEATLSGADLEAGRESFNPRLRVGGDAEQPQTTINTLRFQSTPPRGRRRRPPVDSLPPEKFQSTPPRGRRLIAIYLIFNG